MATAAMAPAAAAVPADGRPSSHFISLSGYDGNLLEGHVTVYSSSMKSVLQHVTRLSEENRVLIEDLQDQLLSIRSRATRAAQRAAASAIAQLPTAKVGLPHGSGASGTTTAAVTAHGADTVLNAGAHFCPDADGLRKRVELLEGFLAVFGVRFDDVRNLSRDFGNPIVIPPEYTTYLLHLPVFSYIQQEMRAMGAAQHQWQVDELDRLARRVEVMEEAMARAHDESVHVESSASKSSAQQSKDAAPKSGLQEKEPTEDPQEQPHGKQPSRRGGRPTSSSSSATPSPPPGDVEDRIAQSSKGKGKGGKSERTVSAESSKRGKADRRDGEQVTHSQGGSAGKAAYSQHQRNYAEDGLVDQVAREDAALSLKQIQRLESEVNRRMKELSALATASNSRRTHDDKARPGRDASADGAKDARKAGPAAPSSVQAIDKVAREDVVICMERLEEFESEMEDRWRRMEERVRLVGRAAASDEAHSTSTKGQAQPAAATTDRKAREDISMCTMRVQNLEKEIIALKRSARGAGKFSSDQALSVSTSPTRAGAREPQQSGIKGTGGGGAVPPVRVGEKVVETRTAPKKGETSAAQPSEYLSRVEELEKEVNRRMQEVNRVLTSLDLESPRSKDIRVAKPVAPTTAGAAASGATAAVQKKTSRNNKAVPQENSDESEALATVNSLQDHVDALKRQLQNVDEALIEQTHQLRAELDVVGERLTALEEGPGLGGRITPLRHRALGYGSPARTGGRPVVQPPEVAPGALMADRPRPPLLPNSVPPTSSPEAVPATLQGCSQMEHDGAPQSPELTNQSQQPPKELLNNITAEMGFGLNVSPVRVERQFTQLPIRRGRLASYRPHPEEQIPVLEEHHETDVGSVLAGHRYGGDNEGRFKETDGVPIASYIVTPIEDRPWAQTTSLTTSAQPVGLHGSDAIEIPTYLSANAATYNAPVVSSRGPSPAPSRIVHVLRAPFTLSLGSNLVQRERVPDMAVEHGERAVDPAPGSSAMNTESRFDFRYAGHPEGAPKVAPISSKDHDPRSSEGVSSGCSASNSSSTYGDGGLNPGGPHSIKNPSRDSNIISASTHQAHGTAAPSADEGNWTAEREVLPGFAAHDPVHDHTCVVYDCAWCTPAPGRRL